MQISKAIANNPPILLLDEVTTGLDLSVQAKVLDLIRTIQQELGIAMMIVSHDLSVIRMMSDRTMVMLGGRVVEEGLTDQILEDLCTPTPKHWSARCCKEEAMGELVIQNVNVVLPDQVLENGSVRLQDQLIQEVSENPWLGPESPDGRILDGQGAFLLPGLIDIHSDNIETVIQPRPQSMIDFELAMREQEKQLVCQGITTMYHSLTIMDTNFVGERVAQKQQLRSPENLTRLIGLIRNFHEGDHLIATGSTAGMRSGKQMVPMD